MLLARSEARHAHGPSQHDTFPLLTRLKEGSETILLAGAGGGYDVFCALPLLFKLHSWGKEVILGNLSFSDLAGAEGEPLTNRMLQVTAETSIPSSTYFPERYLCEWLDQKLQGRNSIYCLERTGVAPIREAYEALVARHEVDTVVLVDGGTDSLMRGDEFGLGTPHEDIASIAAISELEVQNKFLVCIGFGIDTYHGVNHFQFLEAVAALTKSGDFLGGGPLLKETEEAQLYREATDYVFEKMSFHPSIVNSSVLSAVEGEYGDYHATFRTEGSRLWINPLMTLFWAFDLDAVAKRCLYLDRVLETKNYLELSLAIEQFRESLESTKPWEEIPA